MSQDNWEQEAPTFLKERTERKNSKFSCLASLGIVTTKRSHISGGGKNVVKYLYNQNLQIDRKND